MRSGGKQASIMKSGAQYLVVERNGHENDVDSSCTKKSKGKEKRKMGILTPSDREPHRTAADGVVMLDLQGVSSAVVEVKSSSVSILMVTKAEARLQTRLMRSSSGCPGLEKQNTRRPFRRDLHLRRRRRFRHPRRDHVVENAFGAQGGGDRVCHPTDGKARQLGDV